MFKRKEQKQESPALPQNLFDGVARGIPGKDLQEQTPPLSAFSDPATIAADPSFKHNGRKFLIGTAASQVIGVEDDRHILLCAGSRSGKGRSVIIPNLLHYKGSVLAIDPKGELANITARRRGVGVSGKYDGLGQKICVLDPFDRTADWLEPYKKSFNPMSLLKPDSPTLIEDAGLIADAIVIASGHDQHWDESAKNFIEALIIHVATYVRYEGQRDLVTVRKLLSTGACVMDGEDECDGEDGLEREMFDNSKQLEERDEIIATVLKGAIADYFEKPDNERASVKSTARRHTKFLDFPALQTVLRETSAEDTFDLTELKTHTAGMTIYLCLPTARLSSCSRWFRLFVNQAMDALERREEKPPIPVLFCLDEFPVLGHMKQIEAAAGYMAGFGVKLLTVIQDLSQLKHHYKDSWETFLGNAGIWQFFGNNDLTTLEFIQKRVGQTTMIVRNKSQTAHNQRMTGATGASWNVDVRDILTPEEASRIFGRGDKLQRQLVIHGGEDPMILSRLNYDQHPYFEQDQGGGKRTKIYDKWGY